MRKAKATNPIKETDEQQGGAGSVTPGSETRRGRGRPRKAGPASPSAHTVSSAAAGGAGAEKAVPASMDLSEKVRELVRLAKEQGHLTYDEVNDALSDEVATPGDLDAVLTKLRSLEIEIVDPAEVECGKEAEGEEARGERLDILAAPPRTYLRPLLMMPF